MSTSGPPLSVVIRARVFLLASSPCSTIKPVSAVAALQEGVCHTRHDDSRRPRKYLNLKDAALSNNPFFEELWGRRMGFEQFHPHYDGRLLASATFAVTRLQRSTSRADFPPSRRAKNLARSGADVQLCWRRNSDDSPLSTGRAGFAALPTVGRSTTS